MRSVIVGIVVIVAAAGGLLLWNKSKGGRPSSAEVSASKPSAVAVAGFGTINFTVGVAGEIGPAEQVSVRPEVNGRISELPVDVGDRVKKGALLFALDDRDLGLEVETRENQIEGNKLQLDKARLAMDQAKRDYERDQHLFEAKLLAEQAFEATRQRYDSSMKDHDLAQNSIERAEKDLALAQERLSKTRIEAPFDCTVLTRPVSVGQAVSGSGGFNSGTEVLTIADLSSMVINAHVNQADVTRLKHGMQVEVEVDAVPGLRIDGGVERIAPQATVKNNIKGYATRIALKEVDPRVQPGMTASITIPVSAADDVLTVPLSAVFSEQGERYVFVRNGESFERRDVVVGVSDLMMAEITSGLSAGEVVALEPLPSMMGRAPGKESTLSQTGGRPVSTPPRPTPGGTRPASTAAAAGPTRAPATNDVGTTRPASGRPAT